MDCRLVLDASCLIKLTANQEEEENNIKSAKFTFLQRGGKIYKLKPVVPDILPKAKVAK